MADDIAEGLPEVSASEVPVAEQRLATLEEEGAEIAGVQPGRLKNWWNGLSADITGNKAKLREAARITEERIVAKSSRKVFGKEGEGFTRDELLEIEDKYKIYPFSKNTITTLQELYADGREKAARLATGGVVVTDEQIQQAVDEIAERGGPKSSKGTIARLGAGGILGGATGGFFGAIGQAANAIAGKDKDVRKAHTQNIKSGQLTTAEIEEAAAARNAHRTHRFKKGMLIGAGVGAGAGLLSDGKHASEAARYDAAAREAIELGLRAELAASGVEVEAKKTRVAEEAKIQQDVGYAQAEGQASQYTPRTLNSELSSGETLLGLQQKLEMIRTTDEAERAGKIEALFAPSSELRTVQIDRNNITIVGEDGSAAPLPESRRNQPIAILPDGLSPEDIQAELDAINKCAPRANVVLAKVPDDHGVLHDAFVGVSGSQASAYSAHAAAERAHPQIVQSQDRAAEVVNLGLSAAPADKLTEPLKDVGGIDTLPLDVDKFAERVAGIVIEKLTAEKAAAVDAAAEEGKGDLRGLPAKVRTAETARSRPGS